MDTCVNGRAELCVSYLAIWVKLVFKNDLGAEFLCVVRRARVGGQRSLMTPVCSSKLDLSD